MSVPNKTINVGTFQAHFKIDGITIYSTEKRHDFSYEEWVEIADQYRSWRDRVKPFASFQEIAQALLQQSYSPRGQIIVVKIDRSEPVGVYRALVRIGDNAYEVRNWEDWNALQSARGPIKESGL